MRKLLLLVLLGYAVWYGYHHYEDVLHPKSPSEVVIVNATDHDMERIRVAVAGHRMACEALAKGEARTIEFEATGLGEIGLTWEYADLMGERHWEGGTVSAGPMAQRHRIQIEADDAIVYHAELK